MCETLQVSATLYGVKMTEAPASEKICDLRGCEEPLTGRRKRYCSDKHGRLAAQRRWRARQRGEASPDDKPKYVNTEGRTEVTSDGRVSARKPPETFVDDGWYEWIAEGDTTMAEAARRLDTSAANVSRWFEYVKQERRVAAEAAQWEMSPEAKRALADFRYFRERYFVVARAPFKGQPFVTEPFHLNWINSILKVLPEDAGGSNAAGIGGQQLILSPPRHGKTMLLVHFIIWLILRNPDIAIIWLAKSQTIAQETGSVIRDELERNEKLIAEMLGPGGTFKPGGRSGAAWRDDELEVATRTIVQRAPTFRAIGRGGTLQSVDADFLVTDDIEDHDSTRTPHQRQATLDWLLTEVESRKEMHTAWLCIGSRNHPQDVLAHLLKAEDWHAIVESAHDRDCERSVEDPKAHTDCMLWPKKFPYTELQKKIRNSGQQIVQMRYLNDPQAEGITVFVEATMRSPDILDRSRVLGSVDLPDGYELLGSIDPSPSINQIAQLWGYSKASPVRHLVDVHAGKGGMDAWEDLVKAWLEKYQLRRWIVEDNSAQADYINRRDFVKWRQDNAVHVHGQTTGRNKHSLGMGVGSMHPLYVNKHIVLPYGDSETQGKIDAFIREHVSYDPDQAQTSRRRVDRVMAAWLANTYIDLLQGGRAQVEVEDNTPDWMQPAGLDWISNDSTGGWL